MRWSIGIMFMRSMVRRDSRMAKYVVTVPDWVEYDEVWIAIKDVVGHNPMKVEKVV